MSYHFVSDLIAHFTEDTKLISAAYSTDRANLENQIRKAAYVFRQHRAQKGERAIVVIDHSVESIIALLGAIYAGVTAVPIEASRIKQDLSYYLDITEPSAIWKPSGIAHTWPISSNISVIEGMPEGHNLLAEPIGNDLAALMSTSGTLGKPKFVEVSHVNLRANTLDIIESQELSREDRAMLVLPVSYCFGASVLYSHLYAGGSVVVDKNIMFPNKVLDAINEHSCTTFSGVPSVFTLLINRSNLSKCQLPTLKKVFQAGGHLNEGVIRKLTEYLPEVRFFRMYGQTEATARIACNNPDKSGSKRGSVGRLMSSLQIKIVRNKDAQGSSREGVIWVSGDSICRGYWRDAEATRSRFIDGWLNTHDVGYLDEAGDLFITGRNADFMKIRGRRIAYREIEQKALEVEAVDAVAVLAETTADGGDIPIIFYTVDPDAERVPEADQLKEHFPHYWDCKNFIRIDSIPLNERGKVDRRQLAAISDAASIDALINTLLDARPYEMNPDRKRDVVLPVFKKQLRKSARSSKFYKSYLQAHPDFEDAQGIAELPFLPVTLFKSTDPISLVEKEAVIRTMLSSATTGQMPSRIALDRVTSKRMTKGVTTILKDFIGAERRPYLVIDQEASNMDSESLSARGAAIRGISPFATQTTYCLESDPSGSLRLNRDKIEAFFEKYKNEDVIVYGFTSIIWKHLIQATKDKPLKIEHSRAHVLHSGGWKKLQSEAVSKSAFNALLAGVFSCETSRIIDFYGLVENLGIVYPDCEHGNKHVPAFGEVVIRNPLTFQPVGEGEVGILQVSSVLPNSFPGHLLLTEDVARVIHYDGCPCGRKGLAFRIEGRMPKAEVRGCGNVNRKE